MSAPTAVRYVKVSNLQEGNQYLIEWWPNPDSEGISQYKIYRSEANYTGFDLVGTVDAGCNQFVDRVPKNWGN